MFKKKAYLVAITSLLLCPSTSLFAHTTTTAQPLVNIPSLQANNELSVGPVFLRPGGSNDYAVLTTPFDPSVATPILTPNWEPKGINPNFETGFVLNYRYNLAQTGNDININWARLRTADSATFPVNRAAPPAQQFAGPFWNIGPDAGVTSGATGKLKDRLDQFNVEFGQHITIGTNYMSRFFAGVSGLWLQQDIGAGFSGTDPILGPYTFGITTESKYHAAGLRFGMEGEYRSFYNIGVVGMIAGDLFAGSQQPNTSTIGTGSILRNAGIPVNHQQIAHNSYVQVVPGMEAKLGLKFSQQYAQDKRISLEAGYMAAMYVNAIQNYVPSTYVPGSLGIVSGSVFLQSLIKNTESFSVDGFYLVASMQI